MLRGYAARKEGLTIFTKPDTPAYYDSTFDNDMLFPFSYSDGVLDISYAGNRFKEEMVDQLNQSPNNEPGTAIRVMGGPYLVSSLGDNFKAYIRAWRDGTIDAGSPINIHIAPQLLKVQEPDYDMVQSISGDSYLISATVPSGDAYVAGYETNRYRTTYVFKTPLTITIVESGIVQYITFQTILDQE
jgi:hypothetical protein